MCTRQIHIQRDTGDSDRNILEFIEPESETNDISNNIGRKRIYPDRLSKEHQIRILFTLAFIRLGP